MTKKDFLSLLDFDLSSLSYIIEKAIELKKNPVQPLLPSKQLVMIFEKNSTRTRVSFEAGMSQLGGNAIYLNAANTQLGRGESITDTAKVLSRYADIVMIRCNKHQDLIDFANNASIPVINGLSDHSHPCQLMADLMTFHELKGSIKGKKVAWLGDGNNMCNSWVMAAHIFGFELSLALSPKYPADEKLIANMQQLGSKITVTSNPEEACKNADLVTTDTWVSMGDEDANERISALQSLQVTPKLMKLAKTDAIFMHCLPAHREEEVTSSVIDGEQSVIYQEAENRLHAQKAIMCYLLNAI